MSFSQSKVEKDLKRVEDEISSLTAQIKNAVKMRDEARANNDGKESIFWQSEVVQLRDEKKLLLERENKLLDQHSPKQPKNVLVGVGTADDLYTFFEAELKEAEKALDVPIEEARFIEEETGDSQPKRFLVAGLGRMIHSLTA